MTTRAVAEIAFAEQPPRTEFSHRFLLFDTDRLGQSPARDQEMKQLAREKNLVLVRQGMCLEAVLLRHFKDHGTAHPMTSADALNRLQNIWPDYRKGASAMDLAKRIGLSDVRRAAASSRNLDLAAFLRVLGLMPGK